MPEYRLRPNEHREGWPVGPPLRGAYKTKDDFEAAVVAYNKAIAAAQATVRHYGYAYDTNLDWREMVLEVTAAHTTDVLDQKGERWWTLPWRDPANLTLLNQGKCVIVRPCFSYGEFSDRLGLGLHVRYVYVTWDVREDGPIDDGAAKTE